MAPTILVTEVAGCGKSEPGVLRVDAMQPRAMQGEAILRWLGHAVPQPLMETPP